MELPDSAHVSLLLFIPHTPRFRPPDLDPTAGRLHTA
jgi:hypothetical protein